MSRKKSHFCDKANVEDILVFDPDRTYQIWRFFTYMFLHANMVHLGWNFSMQIIFGKKLFYKRSNLMSNNYVSTVKIKVRTYVIPSRKNEIKPLLMSA